MGLTKVTYQDLVTVIAALNLNDIQDAIIALEGILPSIAPEYSVNTSYTPGDYVVYQNVLYKCTSATSGAWNPSKWTACNFGDEMQAYEESTDAELRSLFADLVESITTEYSATAMYDVGDIVEKDGLIYKCIVPIITPEAWTASHWTAIDLSNEIAEAQRDATEGYSDTLTAGDLTSDEYAEDSEPYLFRRTFGGANNHEMDTLVGGTVAWNQLLQNGNFADTSVWSLTSGSVISLSVADNIGTVTFNVTPQAGFKRIGQNADFVSGHKYLATVELNPSTNENVLQIYAGSNGATLPKAQLTPQANVWQTWSPILTASATANATFVFGYSGTHEWSVQIRNFMLFDLTQMFGSTIADAIYAMEQAESGSGVAWFRKYFPESYYAYDSGSLKSVEAVAHRMTGKNLLDTAVYSNIGTSVKYKPLYVGEGTFTMSTTAPQNSNSNANLFFLSGSVDTGAVTRVNGVWSGTPRTVTSKNGYVTVGYCSRDGVDPSLYDTQIEYGSTATTFKPFAQHTYKLSQLTLRGIPKLTNGHLTYDGDTYEPSGQVVRKYGVVDLGTLTNWASSTITEGNNRFYAGMSGVIKAPSSTSVMPNILCTALPTKLPSEYNQATEGITIYTNSSIQIYSSKYATYTVEQFKTAMSGVYLVYELQTPSTEQASPYEPTQVVYADGTEEYISNNIVPVGHNTRYPVSIKQALTQIATAPSANGTYILKCTVSGGVASYSWVTE